MKKYVEVPGRDVCYCQAEEMAALGLTCERCHRQDEIEAAKLDGARAMGGAMNKLAHRMVYDKVDIESILFRLRAVSPEEVLKEIG